MDESKIKESKVKSALLSLPIGLISATLLFGILVLAIFVLLLIFDVVFGREIPLDPVINIVFLLSCLGVPLFTFGIFIIFTSHRFKARRLLAIVMFIAISISCASLITAGYGAITSKPVSPSIIEDKPTVTTTSSLQPFPTVTPKPSSTSIKTPTSTQTPKLSVTASLTPSFTSSATASYTRTATPSPTITPDPAAAMILVAHYVTESGNSLNDVLMQKSSGQQVFGWYSEVCSVPICAQEGAYLVAFKYVVLGLGPSIPIWYVDEQASGIYFVNGKAKGLTPELAGAFIEGLVLDTFAAFDLFENKPIFQGVLDP